MEFLVPTGSEQEKKKINTLCAPLSGRSRHFDVVNVFDFAFTSSRVLQAREGVLEAGENSRASVTRVNKNLKEVPVPKDDKRHFRLPIGTRELRELRSVNAFMSILIDSLTTKIRQGDLVQ